MILTDNPYYNEPGYERSAGTAQGQRASQAYDDHLLPHTMDLAIARPATELAKESHAGVYEPFRQGKPPLCPKHRASRPVVMSCPFDDVRDAAGWADRGLRRACFAVQR
ncbi:unnamed protein product [Pedinophyceae sp. YPF-701]|nr:unnamed protein product [Pedinophyceae sp. YPF-701]